MSWIKKFFAQPPTELSITHNQAKRNFTYIPQPGEGHTYLRHNITLPFKGDCDDFACSVMAAMGPEAEYIEFYLPSGRYHAACLYRGWVSDNTRTAPYPVTDIKQMMGTIPHMVILIMGRPA